MKKICFIVLFAFAFLFSFNACKPKESAYRSVYERAKSAQREKEQQKDRDKLFASIEQSQQTGSPSFASSSSSSSMGSSSSSSMANIPGTSFQRERITALDGSGVKPYSVVIGSFVNKTNAESLKDRMRARGYNTFLVKNEKGMYRVIAASFDSRSEAIQLRERIKDKYDSEFADAWLLERIN
ncbi:MAG: SPOR domain-containing protein [Candidatus Azobacteroides sp.]|nr:SPOR domain-containing protein [Candidatus Azobacteroides sp.]